MPSFTSGPLPCRSITSRGSLLENAAAALPSRTKCPSVESPCWELFAEKTSARTRTDELIVTGPVYSVDVAVGSNGYRSAYVRSDLPVGKTGTLSIAVGETRFNGRSGNGYGGRFGGGQSQSLGLGLSLGGDAALDPRDPRCRQFGEERPSLASDQRFEGGRPRACSTAGSQTSP